MKLNKREMSFSNFIPTKLEYAIMDRIAVNGKKK
jgi:hypothetical protein